jgi:Glycosyl transferases group 1
MIAAICDDPHVKAIAPYFRRGVYAELLRAKVSGLPSGSVSFFNEGMKFIELAPHYHSASIFAFPSVWEEPFGMPLVEAMASGTLVVTTHGGAPSRKLSKTAGAACLWSAPMCKLWPTQSCNSCQTETAGCHGAGGLRARFNDVQLGLYRQGSSQGSTMGHKLTDESISVQTNTSSTMRRLRVCRLAMTTLPPL